MHKETSSRVSSIAAKLVHFGSADLHAIAKEMDGAQTIPAFVHDIRSLAASCLSQDEHSTQAAHKIMPDFHERLKIEREELDERITKLTQFLGKGTLPGIKPLHKEMLGRQLIAMSEYLVVLDERLADLAISDRSAPVEEIEDHEDGDDGA